MRLGWSMEFGTFGAEQKLNVYGILELRCMSIQHTA
jgi:hypothetical protein